MKKLLPLLFLPVFAHGVELDAELCTADAKYYVEGGCPADLQDPIAGGNVGDTTADGSVVCSGICVGTVHAFADAAADGTPDYATCLAGTGALNKQTDAITGEGTSNFNFINLTAATSIRITYCFEPNGSNYDNRPFNDVEVAADFLTSGGGGSGAARYIKPGGNDSLAGTSDATAWATVAKLNSVVLPAGTEVYFETDGTKADYGNDVYTITHDGDGAGDDVRIDSYCMVAGTETPYNSALPECGDRAIISGVNVLGIDTFLDKVKIADTLIGNVVKWNPGYWMLLKGSLSNNANPDSDRTTRHADYLSIQNEDKVVGAVTIYSWNNMEYITRGNYGSASEIEWGIGKAINDCDYLHSIGKKCIIRFKDVYDKPFDPNYFAAFPNYVISEGTCLVDANNKGVYRVWDASCRTDYINALVALVGALNDHPAFEGIAINQENAIDNAGQLDGTYSHEGYIAGYQAVATAVKAAAAPNSSVVINWNNQVAGMSLALFHSMYDWMKLNDIGTGWPDSRPVCTTNCATDPVTYAAASSQPADHNYFHDGSSAGSMVIFANTEASELGAQTVGDPAGYTPNALHDYHDDQGHWTHRNWIRADFLPATPTGQKEWCWDQVAEVCTNGPPDYWILDEINARTPSAASQVCPSYYNSRCYTDAD